MDPIELEERDLDDEMDEMEEDEVINFYRVRNYFYN
jgi:hypothetical protein